ncbi:MAG: MoaD/ThiS family protein [Pseudomonadales bacterium]|nr:MoaD/ThiS family protein [Pseudomonadales bacterium]
MVKIKLHFFASIRELVGTAELSVEVSAEITPGVDAEENNAEEKGEPTVIDALRVLRNTLGESCWQELEKSSYKVAINQAFVELGHSLIDGDEVALLPQVTGG